MKLRRLTGQYLPCLRKDSTPQLWQKTAALRDFAPAYDRCGSISVISAMHELLPLIPLKQRNSGHRRTSRKCQKLP